MVGDLGGESEVFHALAVLLDLFLLDLSLPLAFPLQVFPVEGVAILLAYRTALGPR